MGVRMREHVLRCELRVCVRVCRYGSSLLSLGRSRVSSVELEVKRELKQMKKKLRMKKKMDWDVGLDVKC